MDGRAGEVGSLTGLVGQADILRYLGKRKAVETASTLTRTVLILLNSMDHLARDNSEQNRGIITSKKR